MNISKTALALGIFGAQAFADDGSTAQQKTAVENYTYESKLDVKKVISRSDIPKYCGPVPVKMTYEDSQGQQHILEYLVMGECSNG